MNSIESALTTLALGQPVVLLDHVGRENEGDLICPAETITQAIMAQMIQHGSGIVCLPMTAARAKALALPLMVAENTALYHTNFTVSIDAKVGVSTGISAADRVRTVQAALQDQQQGNSLDRPGHLFPLVAHEHGVLARPGHTEGALDLVRLAGFEPMAVICELMHADGTVMRQDALTRFAAEHDYVTVTIDDLIAYRWQHESIVKLKVSSTLQLAHMGEVTMRLFYNPIDQQESLLISKATTHPHPLVRLHSACFTGDVLGSLHCDCQSQLHKSMQLIAEQGGHLLYLPQEGRGIGLANKLKAYNLQANGYDTVEANELLGFAPDLRDYAVAAQILHAIGVTNPRLLSNNPTKLAALKTLGITPTLVPLPGELTTHNQHYLATKQALGHLMETVAYAE